MRVTCDHGYAVRSLGTSRTLKKVVIVTNIFLSIIAIYGNRLNITFFSMLSNLCKNVSLNSHVCEKKLQHRQKISYY